MKLRSIILRLMLAALGLAALAGVAAVVTAGDDTLWRIIWTGVVTAVTLAVMLPFSFAVDKEVRRVGGLSGMAWAVGAFLLFMGVIWWDYGWRSGDYLLETLAFWLLCGLPAVAMAFGLRSKQLHVAAWTGIAVTAGTFGLAMIAVWTNIAPYAERCADTSTALAGFGLLAVVNLVHVGCKDRHFFRWAGVLGAAAALAIAVTGIWRETDTEWGRRIMAAAGGIAGVLAMANVAFLLPLLGIQRLIRWGTLATGFVCAVGIDVLVGFNSWSRSDFFQRMTTASGIVAASGALALGVMARLNRKVEFPAAAAAHPMLEMEIVCPRCARRQKMKIGGDVCGGCQLHIDVRIEEPRCPTCGYLLYRLTSGRCPECGTDIGGERAPKNI